MLAPVIILHPDRPPVPGLDAVAMMAQINRLSGALTYTSDTIREQRIEIVDLRDQLEQARVEIAVRYAGREMRAFCIAAFVAGALIGAAGASFAAPLPPVSEVCSALVAEADAHAVRVVPDWPMGVDGQPTEEQADEIWAAADGEGDPDALAALEIGDRAGRLGCW